MGPSGALAGPDVVIPDTVRQTRGTNLFHSFGVFNINTGESATFTGPPVIDNVLSRVTGGSQSFIDGLLRSTIERRYVMTLRSMPARLVQVKEVTC
jgi:large exoprotein involved in heme utilization and adhesion